MPSDRVLLVEGPADKLLFDELCKIMGISTDVRVTAPRDFSGEFNTKGGVCETIPLLAKQMNDGQLKRVAAVVDADFQSNHGMGANLTINHFAKIFTPLGFDKRRKMHSDGGYFFDHNDGLNPIGIWVMPDNLADGTTEDWVLQSAKQNEAGPIAYARQTLNNVPGGTRYIAERSSKAVAAIWMGWQPIPGQGLHQAVRDNLLDSSNPLFASLMTWLKAAFP